MPWRDWIRTVEIEPALDAADASALLGAIEGLLRTGSRVFHVHVRSLAAASEVGSLAELVHHYDGVLDVHLENYDPTAAFAEVAAAGADGITFDARSVADPAAAIAAARTHGVQVGIAFGPDVDVEQVAAGADGADLVLCGCVGEHVIQRVRRVASLLRPGIELQVEGEVTAENVGSLYRAGGRLLVVDSPIFSREDLPRAYRQLVQLLA